MTMWHAVLAVIACVTSCACGSDKQSDPPRSPSGIAAPAPVEVPAGPRLRLPNKPGSVKFAAIGDAGRGDQWQYDVSAQMQIFRKLFPFDFVVMLGDNVYDGGTPSDYLLKFQRPYQPLLDEHVTFHAVIGNHDDPNQPSYAPFNMGGQRYYTFKPHSGIRFFALDSGAMDKPQLEWIEKELAGSESGRPDEGQP